MSSDDPLLNEHSAFLEGMRSLFVILVKMDYLQGDEISFSPHVDLPVGLLREAGYGEDVIDLLFHTVLLKRQVFEDEGLEGDGITLAPSFSVIPYLSRVALDRAREVIHASGDKMPSTTLKLAWMNET